MVRVIVVIMPTLKYSAGFAPVIAFLAISVALAIMTAIMVRKKRSPFVNRQDYAPHDLWRMFFSEFPLPERDVIAILREVSSATDIPLGKLRPRDRFEVELAPLRGWEFDDGLLLLPECMKRIFGGDVDAYNLQQNATIACLMQTVSQRVL